MIFKNGCVLLKFIFFSAEEHENANNYNFDSPNALDFDLAYQKINCLLRYEDVEVPIYDFALH
jgi:uridine kinase